jgi:hypothetical protein
MRLSILGALALASVVMASAAAAGCDGDEHDHSHGTSGGAHTSPYPDCNAITQACHEVDVGEGPIHDCHERAHAAKSEADCTPMKDDCLAICAAAKNDAGGGSSSGGEDSGTGAGGEDSGAGHHSDAGH